VPNVLVNGEPVPREGLEPSTYALKGRSSTIELSERDDKLTSTSCPVEVARRARPAEMRKRPEYGSGRSTIGTWYTSCQSAVAKFPLLAGMNRRKRSLGVLKKFLQTHRFRRPSSSSGREGINELSQLLDLVIHQTPLVLQLFLHHIVAVDCYAVFPQLLRTTSAR
jgi:hypothetical protein